MPKWVILPILLSALFHILAGGTMPHYMVGSGLSFEEEMKKQFQTVEVSQLKPVKMDKVKQEVSDDQITGKKEPPDIKELVNEVPHEIKDVPVPTPSENTESLSPSEVKRKLSFEKYPLVVRRGKAQIDQDIVSPGAEYGSRRIDTEIVAQARFGTGNDPEGIGIGIGAPAIKTLKDDLLTASVQPNLDIDETLTAVTSLTPSTSVRKAAPALDEGFIIPLVNVPKAGEGVTDVTKDVLPEIPVIPPEDVPGLEEEPEVKKPFIIAETFAPDVTTEFKVFRKPGEDKSYFELTIKVKENAKLVTIPKNLLFVVDISLSIPREELSEVRKAVETYLKKMNPEDRFNVVRFSEQARRKFFTFVQPTPKRIADAVKFIDKAPGQVKTDVYRVLHSIILNIFSRTRPCIVFFVTDGVSTEGVKDSRRIVRDISPITRSNISVFPFDIGEDGNRYLLDLVAYRSRGQLVNTDLSKASPQFAKLCKDTERPVLMNLSVHYANLRTDEVYPPILPNLYRDGRIVIYGQCEPGREAAVQIYGQAAGGKWKKFIYPIKIPEESTGESAIAKDWARGKIHYLVSRLARQGDNPKMIAEVVRLGKKYKLPVPYKE